MARVVDRLPPVESMSELVPLPSPLTEEASSLTDASEDAATADSGDTGEEKKAEAKAAPVSSLIATTDAWLDWFAPGAAEVVQEWRRPWSGSCEFGIDGTCGNNEGFNIRIGLDAKRKTSFDVLTLDLDYNKKTNNSFETANRLFLDWRYELPCKDTPWSWFAQGTTTYDEFQPWNVRVSLSTGLGYEFLKTDKSSVIARFGGGASHEVGGLDDAYVPELNYGLDAEHQFSKRQKIKLSTEYYPDMTEFENYRIISKADWEVLLDEEMNLSLKLSAANRFKRPNPGGKLNDLDYSLVLLWKF